MSLLLRTRRRRSLRPDRALRTLSGVAKLGRVERRVEIDSMSGDMHLSDAPGALRLRTQSGDVRLALRLDAVPALDFQSASGDLTLRGRCEKGCSLRARTASGDLRLTLRRDSGFGLGYQSATGDLNDRLGLNPGNGRRTYGSGAGEIQVHSASGSLTLEAD